MSTKVLALMALGCFLISTVVFWVWKSDTLARIAPNRVMSNCWFLSFVMALVSGFALGACVVFRTERDIPGRVLGLFVLVILEGSVAWVVELAAGFIGQ